MGKVELYEGTRRTYSTDGRRMYTHCPKCGHLAPFAKPQRDGMLFACLRCGIAFTDRGKVQAMTKTSRRGA